MVKEQYPYVDKNGIEHDALVKHYSSAGKILLQVETGIKYPEAIDVYPCRYTYKETEEQINETN